MRPTRDLVITSIILGAILLGGCFRPALEQDSSDSTSPDEVADGVEDTQEADQSQETTGEEVDVAPPVDASDSDAPPPGDLTEPDLTEPDLTEPDLSEPETVGPEDADAESDTAPECSVDGDCAAFANPPCVVGRCSNRRCTSVNVSVPCDDGDLCTTADQCSQGVCRGRAFTEAESRNWVHLLGGDGEDAAIGVAAHPSGEVSVVGVFEGTMQLPGGASLVASGGLDGFIVRFSQTGTVLHALAFGEEASDEVPTLVAAAGDDLALVWGSLPVGGGVPPHFSWAMVRSRDDTVDGSPVAGLPVAMDVVASEGVYIVSSIVDDASIRMNAGGDTVLRRADGIDGFIARFAGVGADWVRGVRGMALGGPSFDWYHRVSAIGGQLLWLGTLAPDAAVGGSGGFTDSAAARPALWEVVFDSVSGQLVSKRDLSPWIFAPGASRYQDESLVLTGLRVEGPMSQPSAVFADGSPRGRGLETICPLSVQLDLSGDIVFGTFAAAEAQTTIFVTATNGKALQLGGGIAVGAGAHRLVVAAYSSDCDALSATPMSLAPVEDKLPRVEAAGVGEAFAHITAGPGGRAYVTGMFKGAGSSGLAFDNTLLTARGTVDGVIGSLGPASLFGCSPSSP